ncbi:MAG: protein IsiD [Elainellaceae cyanobacterium]
MTTLSFSKQDVDNVTDQDVAKLAQRLDQDEYSNPFDGLRDWHLLRAIAFQRPEMVEPYLYLLDMEAYDES